MFNKNNNFSIISWQISVITSHSLSVQTRFCDTGARKIGAFTQLRALPCWYEFISDKVLPIFPNLLISIHSTCEADENISYLINVPKINIVSTKVIRGSSCNSSSSSNVTQNCKCEPLAERSVDHQSHYALLPCLGGRRGWGGGSTSDESPGGEMRVIAGKLRPSAALIDFLSSLEGWRRTETGHKATSLIHGFRTTTATAILSVDCCFRMYGQDCFNTHLQTTKHLSAYKLIAPFPQVKNHHHHHTCQIETTWLISASQYIWCIYRNLTGGQNEILSMPCCKAPVKNTFETIQTSKQNRITLKGGCSCTFFF